MEKNRPTFMKLTFCHETNISELSTRKSDLSPSEEGRSNCEQEVKSVRQAEEAGRGRVCQTARMTAGRTNAQQSYLRKKV